MPFSDLPLLSIVVPTVGDESKILAFLDGLGRQRLALDRFELIVVFDGAVPAPGVAARLAAAGARVECLPRRSGPPIARNRGAALARGEFLVSADDDVVPDPDWLARAAERLAAEPDLDVLEGVTVKPGGRAVRIRADEAFQYILCNLVVRRSLFEKIGGFEEAFYDPDQGVYFREDADLGYRLEVAGGKVGRDPGVLVTHPIEHPRYLDPLRWARRYEMDPLLAVRHPRLFRERIEVHLLFGMRIRRPIVRASAAYVISLVLATALAAVGQGSAAVVAAAFALAAFLPVWAKWRFELRRLPVFLLVPFGLMLALARGRARLRRLPPAATGTWDRPSVRSNPGARAPA